MNNLKTKSNDYKQNKYQDQLILEKMIMMIKSVLQKVLNPRKLWRKKLKLKKSVIET